MPELNESNLSTLGKQSPDYFYQLEHLTQSTLHHLGEREWIVLPYVEIGRGTDCNIQFGLDCPSVSRRHIALSWENGKVMLINLSHINHTYVNGEPVTHRLEVKSGDIIRLSADGPQFRVHQTKVNTQQKQDQNKLSLRIIIPVLVLVGLILAFLSYSLYRTLLDQQEVLKTQAEVLQMLRNQSLDSEFARKTDSLRLVRGMDSMKNAYESEVSHMKEEKISLEDKLTSMQSKIEAINIRVDGSIANSDGSKSQELNLPKSDVYFIQAIKLTVFTKEGENVPLDAGWVGTGFLLSDGRFMTARHVIQPWKYLKGDGKDEEHMILANAAELIGGQIRAEYRATSPSGHSFKFTNEKVHLDDSQDRTGVVLLDDDAVQVRYAIPNSTDWAYVKTNKKSTLRFSTERSTHLKAGESVHILGYSYGKALQSKGKVSPLYSLSMVAQDGLTSGLIHVTSRNFAHGNSGGPVLVRDGDSFIAVGIVSSGLGPEVGLVVPINVAK